MRAQGQFSEEALCAAGCFCALPINVFSAEAFGLSELCMPISAVIFLGFACLDTHRMRSGFQPRTSLIGLNAFTARSGNAIFRQH
jgi:hypothetical protein